MSLSKRLVAGLLFAASLLAQNPNTAVFPGSVATDTDLLVATDRAQSSLTAGINASTLTIPVSSSSAFVVPTMVTIDTERIKICTKSAGQLNACSGGRGFNQSSAATHSSGVTVSANISSYYFNQLAAEIKALEGNVAVNAFTTLGDTDYGGVSGLVTRLPGNTTATKKFLTQTGDGVNSAAPGWNTISAGDVPTLNQSTTGNADTATALAATPTCTGCSNIKTITAIAANGNLTPTAIQLAAADGATLGLAAFASTDFDAATGVISLDYTNGQKATGSVPGFLTAADWTTFNGKQASGSYITALTGDVTASGPGSAGATVVNLPTGVTVAGSLLHSGIAAPSSPASGKGSEYFDSTSLTMAVKNAAGTVSHMVQTVAAISHQFATAISDAGVVSLAQPAYSDISGTPTLEYQTVQDEGSDLTQRTKVNFIGPITCADNAGATKTDCTVPNRQITMGVGAGDISSTGVKACSVMRWAGTIQGVYLIANALPTGANLVVDVMKIAFGSYTGSAAPTSITASAVPTIATGDTNPRYSDTMLSGWTTSISAGDIICVKINTAPTGGATWASLTLETK